MIPILICTTLGLVIGYIVGHTRAMEASVRVTGWICFELLQCGVRKPVLDKLISNAALNARLGPVKEVVKKL